MQTFRYRCLECFRYYTSGHVLQWCPDCGGELFPIRYNKNTGRRARR